MADNSKDEAKGASTIARREAEQYFKHTPSDRPWELPFAIALASGLPMMAGALLGDIRAGSLASIGAMTIIYMPRTKLDLRMAALMAAGFAMIACFALGQIGQLLPDLRVPLIALVALLVTLAVRFYRVAPPGPLFFVMAATIAAYAPAPLSQMPEKLGLFALGSLFSVAIAFIYSLHILRHRDPLPPEDRPTDIIGEVVADSIIIASITGLSLFAAELLDFDKPYWVAVSCIAVMQGANLRSVWNRKVQRILGTIVGLALTWMLFTAVREPWQLALAVIALLFVVETTIVRNYALAAIFITPLAITLAEAALSSITDPTALLIARLADTVLGAVFGLLGGVLTHSPAVRSRIVKVLQLIGKSKRAPK